jgi:hypothetical protein
MHPGAKGLFGFAWPVTTLKPNPRIIVVNRAYLLSELLYDSFVLTVSTSRCALMFSEFGSGCAELRSILANSGEKSGRRSAAEDLGEREER